MAFFNNTPLIAASLMLLSLCFAATASPPPEAAQAKDTKYMEAQMTAAADKLEKLVTGVVARALNDPSVDASTKGCLQVCNEVYMDGAEALRKGVASLSHADFYTTNIDLSGYMTDLSTCDDCFEGEALPEYLQNYDVWGKGIARDCLEITAKYGGSV